MLRVCRTGSSFARGTFQCRRTITTNNKNRCGGRSNKSPLVSKNATRHIHMDCIMRKRRSMSSSFLINSQNQRCLFATALDDSSFSVQENGDVQQKPPPPQQQQQQPQQEDEHAPPSRKEIINFANDVLWHTSPQQHCPLGSMSSDLWEDSITALVYCIRPLPADGGDESEAAALHVVENDHHHHDAFFVEQVEAADRILNRLIQEHATRSKASRPWTSALEKWKVPLFQAWLETVDTLPHHEDKHLALERAEKLWRKIHRSAMQKGRKQNVIRAVVGKDQVDSNNNNSNNLPLNEFVSFVRAWLRMNTLQGTEQSIQLLLWDEIPDLFQNHDASRQALIACYHEALQQSVQLGVFNNNNNNSLGDNMDSPSIRQAQRETRQRLVEWMEVLADSVSGWQNVKPNHDFVLLESSKTTPQHHGDVGEVTSSSDSISSFDLQSFEAQVLVKNLMEKVQTAGPHDTEIIHQVVEDWKSVSSSSSSQTTTAGRRPSKDLSNLAGALVDYFIGIHDPDSATLWLSRRIQHDDENNNMDTSFVEKRASAIIALWVQKAAASYTPEAPWRAQDLLTRLEEILVSKRQQQQQEQQAESSSISSVVTAAVDHRLYMAVANLWHTSNEPRGAQKAIQICLDRSVASFHPDFLNLAVKILAAQTASSQVDSSQPPSSWEQTSIRKALALLERHHHDELNNEGTLVSLIHGLEQALARTIKSSGSSNNELLRVARIGLNHGVMPSTKTCELLFSTLTEPDQVVNMVEKVQNAVTKPKIYLYAQAVNRLFGMEKKDRGSRLKRIVGEMLLDRIANGTISLDGGGEDDVNNAANQLRDLLTQVTGMLNYWKRDIACQHIIDEAEYKLMTGMFEPSSLNGESLIPISCYTDMMKILAGRGKRNELLETLQRLVKHYEAGYTSLLPNTSLFKLCMSIVGSSSSQLHGKDKAAAVVVNVKEQEALLNQLIALYITTGKSLECKPTEDLFAIVLQEMIKSPCTAEDAIRAETLIDQMLSLDVEIEKGATCSLAFLVLLSSRTERIFERSMSIYEKMKMAVATDKNPLIFEENNANNILFNLIRVCAQCRGHERQQALPIALKAFGQMHERGLASADKYAFFLQTIGKLIPHDDNASRRERDALLERIFSMACRDGCLNREVKSLFNKQLTHDQMNRLFRRHAGAADGGSREPEGQNPTRRKSQIHDTTTATTTKVENGKHAHV